MITKTVTACPADDYDPNNINKFPNDNFKHVGEIVFRLIKKWEKEILENNKPQIKIY